MATAIVSIFPTETTATYYLPGEPGKPAGGKLFDVYRHWKEKLSLADLSKPKEIIKPTDVMMGRGSVGL
jgi:hypothetical protein